MKRRKISYWTPLYSSQVCLGKQSAQWSINSVLLRRNLPPLSSSCLGGPLYLPLLPPRHRIARRKETSRRSEEPRHSPPCMVWGACGRTMPHQCLRKHIDLKQSDKASVSCSSPFARPHRGKNPSWASLHCQRMPQAFLWYLWFCAHFFFI